MMIEKNNGSHKLPSVKPPELDEEQALTTLDEFLNVQLLYHAAMRQVMTKLQVLDDEFHLRYNHNPIHHMESRLKTAKSIIEKLQRRSLEVSIASMRMHITDIAGIRVMCCYIEDIYTIATLLLRQEDITLVKTNDYIKHPKDSGYRSLHLVVKVPVYLSDSVEYIPVEIQIRTVAMDFWASLDHQLRYKSDREMSLELQNELKECADEIDRIDQKMQSIFKRL